MQYTFEYEERITKINTITIEVADEDEGEEVLDKLADRAINFNHPDDIHYALDDIGVSVTEFCEGSEECEYEVL